MVNSVKTSEIEAKLLNIRDRIMFLQHIRDEITLERRRVEPIVLIDYLKNAEVEINNALNVLYRIYGKTTLELIELKGV